ncbi:biorientation of chromosomes in cell division 1-like 1 [Elysia marginata]|uniref:Biorientation of chromosomes in cell division 1-like 1 n=1 Tax=Elysia marginata TaxID=1093978 RepID=A0AAV4GLT1_9GAST|nr:biorientation of chromosomes in cell division 1-like 1 [Elysia marginata]
MEPEGNPGMDEIHPQTDGKAIQEVINKVKSQGLFDQLRKECLTDVDTKCYTDQEPVYRERKQRDLGQRSENDKKFDAFSIKC